MGERRQGFVFLVEAIVAEEVAVGTLQVARVGGRGESGVVLGAVVRQVEDDHLPDHTALVRSIGLLGVEVEQEAHKAVLAPALGVDVVANPRAGGVRGGERFSADGLLVVIEADAPRLALVLAHVGPRLHPPGLCHLSRSPFRSLSVSALPMDGLPVGYDGTMDSLWTTLCSRMPSTSLRVGI